VRFESLPVIHATLGNFEAELMNTVRIEYKELLRLNFAAGYKLRIRRLLHTATAVFDIEEPTDREAMFYACLNCVFKRGKRNPGLVNGYQMHFRCRNSGNSVSSGFSFRSAHDRGKWQWVFGFCFFLFLVLFL
jgi:hypothetical protein